MQAVDTNVLIRALIRDDPEQGPPAEAFIRDHAPVWVSHVVLVETVWVLESVYDCGKPQLVEALTRIIDNRELFLEEPAVVRAALEMYQAKGKLQFEDCMILEIARKAGHVPLATFDRALGKVEGVIIVS
jgi:predicted nucleic-acid-binding protein